MLFRSSCLKVVPEAFPVAATSPFDAVPVGAQASTTAATTANATLALVTGPQSSRMGDPQIFNQLAGEGALTGHDLQTWWKTHVQPWRQD